MLNCHTIHTAHDPALDKVTQPEVCYKCHLKERAEFFKPSSHPVRFGQIWTGAVIAPGSYHGAGTSTLLIRPTLNETCYTCHADKRGPFLWEHPPASEDCTLCHNAALLTPPGVDRPNGPPFAVPAVPFTDRASERRVDDAGPAGCESFRIPAGRIMHELSFTGARIRTTLPGSS